jgi:hypothetical protein
MLVRAVTAGLGRMGRAVAVPSAMMTMGVSWV